jgi:anti-sigma B factor antagonist
MEYEKRSITHGSAGNLVTILALSGSFNRSSAAVVRQWLTEATLVAPANVVVNLSKVNLIDSTGLATLIYGLKQARLLNGDLRVCGLQPPIRMLFELTRMDKVFEIYLSEEDAIQAFELVGAEGDSQQQVEIQSGVETEIRAEKSNRKRNQMASEGLGKIL